MSETEKILDKKKKAGIEFLIKNPIMLGLYPEFKSLVPPETLKEYEDKKTGRIGAFENGAGI